MSAAAITNYVFTSHALFEMERRGLSEDLVDRVLKSPEQRWELRPGRDVVQSRIPLGEPPRSYLVRLIVDVGPTPNEVVTAYRTSRIARYWRKPS